MEDTTAERSIALAFETRGEYYAQCKEGYIIALFVMGPRVAYVASFNGKMVHKAECPKDDDAARKQAKRDCKAACQRHYEGKA